MENLAAIGIALRLHVRPKLGFYVEAEAFCFLGVAGGFGGRNARLWLTFATALAGRKLRHIEDDLVEWTEVLETTSATVIELTCVGAVTSTLPLFIDDFADAVICSHAGCKQVNLQDEDLRSD